WAPTRVSFHRRENRPTPAANPPGRPWSRLLRPTRTTRLEDRGAFLRLAERGFSQREKDRRLVLRQSSDRGFPGQHNHRNERADFPPARRTARRKRDRARYSRR